MRSVSSEWVCVEPPQRIEFLGEVKRRPVAPDQREIEVVVKPDESLGFELAVSALALDGSKSMLRTYAAHLPKMIRRKQNKIHPPSRWAGRRYARDRVKRFFIEGPIPSTRRSVAPRRGEVGRRPTFRREVGLTNINNERVLHDSRRRQQSGRGIGSR
jgi:hypothetical protein